MLGMVIEKEKTKQLLSNDSAEAPEAGPAVDTQDHDAEERGMRRSGEDDGTTVSGDGIELQELRTNTDDQDNEQSGLLSDPSAEPGRHRHPRDIFTSGEVVIMEMDIVHILRDQWRYTPTMSGARSTESAASRDRARNFLRRRMGLGFNVRRNI